MTTPPLPSWASRPTRGAPAPGSPSDQQLAAFIGPRWETYRRKFRPYFEDATFVPTWNWAAALLSPFWFLYRKLYLPFVFFLLAPVVGFLILWGDDVVPTQTVPNPFGGPPLTGPVPEASLLFLGVFLSSRILAGGTANFLLYRRAQAAIRVIVPRTPSADAALPLLGRVGGVSWRAVGLGLAAIVGVQILSELAQMR